MGFVWVFSSSEDTATKSYQNDEKENERKKKIRNHIKNEIINNQRGEI